MGHPTMHPAATPRLHRQLAGLGLDAAAILAEAGLHPIHLRGEARAPRPAFLRAKAIAARSVGEVRLGLLLGASTDLDDFDVFGAAIAHARTLEDAIAVGARFQAVWEEGTSATLERSGGRIVVRYDPGPVVDAVAARIDGLQSVVFLARCAVRLLPAAEGALRVGVQGPPERGVDPAVLAGLPRATFRFRQPAWQLDLPEAVARAPLAGAHPAVGRLLSDHLAGELATLQRPDDVVARVRAVGRDGLARDWTLADVARALGTSPRTLQERLAERGTTWSAVLADARLELARELLRHSELSLEQVADRAGFASGSAFSRFFRRREGQAPAAWRAARRG